MRFTSCLVFILTAGSALVAEDRQVKSILNKYRAARPTDQQLAFYSLDWAPSLADAKVRAKKEGRPIFFICITNITASCNFFAGHC